MARLFRKAFLSHLQDQDDLELIVPRRYSPVFWPLMVTVSFFFAAFLAWAFMARLPLIVEARGMILPLGGVREVASLGEGVVVAKHFSGNEKVQAGDILLEVHHPKSDAAYEDERKNYIARMTKLQREREAANQEYERRVEELSNRRGHVSENLSLLRSIDQNFISAMETYVSSEEETLSVQRDSLKTLKDAYDDWEQGLTDLRQKGILTTSSFLQFLHRQSTTLQSFTDISLQVPKSKVEQQRMRRELGELREKISRDLSEIQELSGDIAKATDEYNVTLQDFTVQELEHRQKLLDLERNLWTNSHIFTPYDGNLVAMKKAIGQTVASSESVALLNMATQNRKKMIVLSSRAQSGYLELSLGSKTVRLDISRNTIETEQFLGVLASRLDELSQHHKLSAKATEKRLIISASPENVDVLDRLRLSDFSLLDENGVAVFAMMMTVGDEWQSSENVNIAMLRSEDAKRVITGASALIKPDYEKTLIGSQLEATVKNVSNYVSTSIEAEALVGSSELANLLSGETGGTTVILEFNKDITGQPIWRGGQPSIPLETGTTTDARIHVETVAPIQVLVPFVANIFN